MIYFLEITSISPPLRCSNFRLVHFSPFLCPRYRNTEWEQGPIEFISVMESHIKRFVFANGLMPDFDMLKYFTYHHWLTIFCCYSIKKLVFIKQSIARKNKHEK